MIVNLRCNGTKQKLSPTPWGRSPRASQARHRLAGPLPSSLLLLVPRSALCTSRPSAPHSHRSLCLGPVWSHTSYALRPDSKAASQRDSRPQALRNRSLLWAPSAMCPNSDTAPRSVRMTCPHVCLLLSVLSSARRPQGRETCFTHPCSITWRGLAAPH